MGGRKGVNLHVKKQVPRGRVCLDVHHHLLAQSEVVAACVAPPVLVQRCKNALLI